MTEGITSHNQESNMGSGRKFERRESEKDVTAKTFIQLLIFEHCQDFIAVSTIASGTCPFQVYLSSDSADNLSSDEIVLRSMLGFKIEFMI